MDNIIDHFHKWRPALHSFVFMLITPTALNLKQTFFSNLLVRRSNQLSYKEWGSFLRNCGASSVGK